MGETTDSGQSDVAVVVVLVQGRTLLVRTRRYPEFWQPPGGLIERSDPTPEDAALRELREELGLSLKAEQLQLVARVPTDASSGLVAFFATTLPKIPDLAVRHAEIIDHAWYSSDRIGALPKMRATATFFERYGARLNNREAQQIHSLHGTHQQVRILPVAVVE